VHADSNLEGLDWLITDAEYQGQGAGTSLLDWGLEKARNEQMPIHLESTIESMDSYTKRGFRKVADIEISLHAGKDELYHEVGLLWEP
jgi:GNAT superfamily N-acetyltransferase